MAAMSTRRLRDVWERLGEQDPLWAVLSDPAKKGGRWDLADFFATGEDHVRRYIVELAGRHGLALGDRVLDFGCGVGRLSQALAAHATEVVGVDIAGSMIEQAERLNAHPGRVRYQRCDAHRLPFDDGTFDSAVSLMVVQHAPPAVQLRVLLELQRVVRPGGTLVLQIPSRPRAGLPVPGEACRAEITVADPPGVLPASATVRLPVRVTNRGSAPWPARQGIKLANHWHRDGAVAVLDDGRTELPAELAVGESVELALLVRAPERPGSYVLELDIVQEFVAWWADRGNEPLRLPVEVSGAAAAAASVPSVEEPVAAEPAAAPTLIEASDQFDMNFLPQELVEGVFAHCGSEVLSAEPDDLAGGDWDSRSYLVRVGEP